MIKSTILTAAAGALLLAAMSSQAQTCISNMKETTKVDQFLNNGDGTVTDLRFGLVWSICSAGQTYDAQTHACTGSASSFSTWSEALQSQQILNDGDGFAGHNDWRLPNIKELRTLIERSCWQPAIKLSIFPDTINGVYWSNTPNTAINDNVKGQVVDFSDGAEFIRPGGDQRIFVRHVRPFYAQQ